MNISKTLFVINLHHGGGGMYSVVIDLDQSVAVLGTFLDDTFFIPPRPKQQTDRIGR